MALIRRSLKFSNIPFNEELKAKTQFPLIQAIERIKLNSTSYA